MNAQDRSATQIHDLDGFTGDIARLEAIFEGWDEAARAAALAYGAAIEALNREALRRLVRSLKADPAALAALKGSVADEIVYAVLRRHDILRPSLAERVERALDTIRPMLASHGGDVELVGVTPPAIEVRFTGACDGCAASNLTFHAGVKTAVEAACPEITEIREARGQGGGSASGTAHFVSPFASGAAGQWRFAGTLSDIPEGGILATELAGEKLLLFRRGPVVTCFSNACAHLGLGLEAGVVEAGIIACPHHDFQYDLTSGECLTAPEVALAAHPVRLVGRRVEIRLAG